MKVKSGMVGLFGDGYAAAFIKEIGHSSYFLDGYSAKNGARSLGEIELSLGNHADPAPVWMLTDGSWWTDTDVVAGRELFAGIEYQTINGQWWVARPSSASSTHATYWAARRHIEEAWKAEQKPIDPTLFPSVLRAGQWHEISSTYDPANRRTGTDDFVLYDPRINRWMAHPAGIATTGWPTKAEAMANVEMHAARRIGCGEQEGDGVLSVQADTVESLRAQLLATSASQLAEHRRANRLATEVAELRGIVEAVTKEVDCHERYLKIEPHADLYMRVDHVIDSIRDQAEKASEKRIADAAVLQGALLAAFETAESTVGYAGVRGSVEERVTRVFECFYRHRDSNRELREKLQTVEERVATEMRACFGTAAKEAFAIRDMFLIAERSLGAVDDKAPILERAGKVFGAIERQKTALDSVAEQVDQLRDRMTRVADELSKAGAELELPF